MKKKVKKNKPKAARIPRPWDNPAVLEQIQGTIARAYTEMELWQGMVTILTLLNLIQPRVTLEDLELLLDKIPENPGIPFVAAVTAFGMDRPGGYNPDFCAGFIACQASFGESGAERIKTAWALAKKGARK
jgi:hypothetical protein